MNAVKTMCENYYQKGRADMLEHIKEIFSEIYLDSRYCRKERSNWCKKEGCNCDDCLYIEFSKILKEQKKNHYIYYKIYVKNILYNIVYDTQEVIKINCDLVQSGVKDKDIKIETFINGIRFNN